MTGEKKPLTDVAYQAPGIVVKVRGQGFPYSRVDTWTFSLGEAEELTELLRLALRASRADMRRELA